MDKLRNYWTKSDHAHRLGEIHIDCAYEPKTPMYHRALFQRIALIQGIVTVWGGQVAAFKSGDLALFYSVASPKRGEIDIAWSRRLGIMVHLRFGDALELVPK